MNATLFIEGQKIEVSNMNISLSDKNLNVTLEPKISPRTVNVNIPVSFKAEGEMELMGEFTKDHIRYKYIDIPLVVVPWAEQFDEVTMSRFEYLKKWAFVDSDEAPMVKGESLGSFVERYGELLRKRKKLLIKLNELRKNIEFKEKRILRLRCFNRLGKASLFEIDNSLEELTTLETEKGIVEDSLTILSFYGVKNA